MNRYIEIFFRFWVRFTILLLIAPVAAGVATIVLFPTYRAYARLWVDNTNYFGTAPAGWSQYLTPAQNEADSLNQLMATRAFGHDLDTQLANDIPNAATRDRAIAAANLQLAPVGTHLVLLSAVCDTPSMCVSVVNASVAVLRAEQVQLEQDQAKEGIDFLKVQLTDATKAEQDTEGVLQQYVQDHPQLKVDTNNAAANGLDASRLVTDVQQARDRVANLETQLSHDEYVLSASTTVYQAGPRVIDPPAVTRGGLIGDGASLKKAGVAAGAIFAVGLAYLLLIGWFDKTARDSRELERRLNVRVVAAIPQLSSVERLS